MNTLNQINDFIAFTAPAGIDARCACLRAGCASFLSKPITQSELLLELTKVSEKVHSQIVD